ncbi:hypothetical protein AOC03_00030 [Psychrobacter urativorans]|uniref:SCP domain-containing protein n=2 Tax=Psychrobacter urativorans TaxID=45610 RepID=A0A0M4T0J3_9GAMM|nr:hypothetical protein AOC03_00030 [Psychrobacter urativorans]
MLSIPFLTTCGVMYKGDTKKLSSVLSLPTIFKPHQPTKSKNIIKPDIVSQVGETEIKADKITNENHSQAAAVGSILISSARQNCGLGAVTVDAELTKIATQHAQYMQYIFANVTPIAFNAHDEHEIAAIKQWTGQNNPYFSGVTLADRLANAQYSNQFYGAVENISHTVLFNSIGKVASPDYVAQTLVKSLLSAPYHLRSLMLPTLSHNGSSAMAYTPHGKVADKSKGYIFVNVSSPTYSTHHNTAQGIFTYPCDNIIGTHTALYDESPNPVARTKRDLKAAPIGQPIYINMPSAQHIIVRNIRLYDIQHTAKVKVELLDYRNDPHKGTDHELKENEAFILPITDNHKSCEVGARKGLNCGLYGHSEYKVSFTVLVDGKKLEKKQFTFKTGNVNY